MWWVAAGVAGGVAVAAGIGDWRRTRRADLDRIGVLDWRTLQMLAVIVAAGCAILAAHAQ